MKKVLITGANSYIGTSLEKWLKESKNMYHVDTLDMVDPSWINTDFSIYDSIFHVAAIVHQNEKKIDKQLYDEVNRDLPVRLAEKAKNAGVRQFIFLSSMSVYGNKEEYITRVTEEKPSTYYGKSKLAAEKGLKKLETSTFKIVILRPPMVYGPKATGNYTRLSKLAKITLVFPKIENQRSMIYIDNLLEFVKKTIDLELSGLYFPQNKEYVTTSDLVGKIAEVHHKKIYFTKLFNPIIRLFFGLDTVKKVFGNLVYEKEMSRYDFEYQVIDFEESIKNTEL
ncbi:TPA: NAD-dependent epimerase/dehydratase family protein [Streptococcus suis]|nr:NAD-dependent epimerase/dehydratase family protein [Streptococcus suis]